MLEEYALVPDIFDPAAYTTGVLADAYLPFLKEPLLNEAIVRDLYDGAWSQYCLSNCGRLHLLTKEILRKLSLGNRLSRFPAQTASKPETAEDWCNESLRSHLVQPLTGIIAAHGTKLGFARAEVASIEKLTGTNWWQSRSPSAKVDRKTKTYLTELDKVFHQANSLMFIDPNLDPSSRNYREFYQLLMPMRQRKIQPRIEIHRSFCKGDGPSRTFPTEAEWQESFSVLGAVGLTIEVFLWDDFHDRCLITDIIGISVGGGFDVTGNKDDWSLWGRMGRDNRDNIQRLFDPAARPKNLKWHFEVTK